MSNDFSEDPVLVKEFLVESQELLDRMNQDLIALERTPDDPELLNRVFRALHTIKGTASFMNFDPVVRLSHSAEDVLNAVRRAEVHFSRRVMDALLDARDQLGQMIVDIGNGGLAHYEIDPLLAELAAVQLPPEIPRRLGDILIEDGTIESTTLKEVVAEQAACAQPPKLGELLVKKKLVSPEEVGHALARQKHAAESSTAAQTMRVDVQKLDELINLIGELVLERNRLLQLRRDFGEGKLSSSDMDTVFGQTASRLSSITDELQAAGLKTRMVPIDAVFRRFPRLVRDVANALQKEVELVVSGQDTELDKTMVELIGDPLLHLVRNSLDHGLELPEARMAAGKPRHGSIHLGAHQEGDQIVIAIKDDGAGIDPERVARKAVEKGLVTAERAQALNKREILDFIFLPGFSTVEKVSDLSGRGVGMDVVRSNLKKMRGTIELESWPGIGTTISLRLPLTLAILPVLLVRVAAETYALPLRSVVETTRMRSEQVHRMEGSEILHLHGQTVPLLRLRHLFQIGAGARAEACDKVVILAVGERRFGLLVDQLVGQESTVVKPLGSYLHHCAGIAGATIGGDGKVRLVLDPAAWLTPATLAPQETA